MQSFTCRVLRPRTKPASEAEKSIHRDYPSPLSGPASVAESDAWPTGGQEVVGLIPLPHPPPPTPHDHRVRQHPFVDIVHEIYSTVILSLPQILEGQLSVSGEKMCTRTG